MAARTAGRGGREGGGRGAVAAARGERRNVWQPTFWRTDGGRPACGVEDRLEEEGFFHQDDDHVPDKKNVNLWKLAQKLPNVEVPNEALE